MRIIRKYVGFILMMAILITPDFCRAAQNVVSRDAVAVPIQNLPRTPDADTDDASVTSVNNAETNVVLARAANTTSNSPRANITHVREAGRASNARHTTERSTSRNDNRTVAASARETSARVARTATSNRTKTITARSASTPTRAATATRAARTAISSRTARSASTLARTATTSRAARTATSSRTARSATNSVVASRAANTNASRAAVSATAQRTRTATELTSGGIITMTEQCKAQYTSCMDNFCNVLDDNQGRCSCSKNIKNYAKTEEALKEATEALKDVAQQIQYIGLTSDEIETLFSQTEAELTMQSASDNSKIKTDLDKIRDLIVDVKSGTASSTDSGLSFDLSGLLDFSIDSTGFDLTTLFGGNQANTNSISNQRGEQLYKTAAARCKTAVLTDCQKQGVDISVITNSYDLEIDKQCIVYERSLTDTNDEMAQTVRNAKSVLQRARLLVAQQKNSYDLRGCINALDSCMQDDYVCGTDYEYCLDPTGKYIVNGEVVVGSTPGYVLEDAAATAPSEDYADNTLYGTWYYGDGKYAWGATIDKGSVSDYISATVIANSNPTQTSSTMSEYLAYKIGYNDGDKNYGMCMSVLNKCQDYTYKDGKYKPDNDVVKQYLERTMIQIKTQQDSIIASYAESCIADVSSCLSTNNYDGNNASKANIAINACRAQIKTCMSVNGDSTQTPTPESMKTWVEGLFTDDANES